ncbi:MAG: translation initiation factor IF-3 [Holosporales bacterium]|nr:translation initiation factor IF-3 [Holosporales bacterium]
MAKIAGNEHNSLLINERITSREVRLIGQDGQPIGIVPTTEAMEQAEAVGLDLVMISGESAPPVCKLLDYGKYKYELQKKKTESRKKQRTVDLKEVQLRPFIGENDLMIKCKAIRKFIEAGNKVKLVLRFRGRELTRKEFGHEVVRKVLDFCQEFAKEEAAPKLEGSVIITTLTKR